jgi:hypothetical protein
MPEVELLWWEGCPSTEKALATLREVLDDEGLDPEAIVLREVRTDGDAERERFVGSPTIRVDGVEVAPVEAEPAGLTCRVYRLRDNRISPTPDPEDIRDVIRTLKDSARMPDRSNRLKDSARMPDRSNRLKDSAQMPDRSNRL